MKKSTKITIIALAAIEYGIVSFPGLLFIYAGLTYQELIAGVVGLYISLAVAIPGLIGAIIVYIISRRGRDDRLTAFTWACISGGLAALAPSLILISWFVEYLTPENEYSLGIASIAAFVLAPILAVSIRRR